MVVVDSHLHVDILQMSLDRIIRYLDNERIDHCWLLTWEEVGKIQWDYHHLAVEMVYEAYTKYPQRIIPFYAPDPARQDAAAVLEQWNQRGIRGCGELKSTVRWDSNNMRPLLETVSKLKLPLVFHMEESCRRPIRFSDGAFDTVLYRALNSGNELYAISGSVLHLLVNRFSPVKRDTPYYTFPGYMLDFSSLENALREFPDIIFIAHGPMFWKHISAEAPHQKDTIPKCAVKGEGIIWRLLRDYNNLHADLSGISGYNAINRDRPNAQKFLSMFKDKLLYGTDCVFKEQRNLFDSLGLEKDVYRHIYGENALKLTGIG